MVKLVNRRVRAEYYIVTDPATIGRHGSNTVRLPGPAVSRFHAQIRRENGQFYIEDMGSTYGTYVNGRLVTGREPLFDGDRITLGVTSAKPRGEWDLSFSVDETPVEDAAEIQADLARRRKPEPGTVVLGSADGALVARLMGRFGRQECDAMLETVLGEAWVRRRNIVLDLGAVTCMNSYALCSLTTLWTVLSDMDLGIAAARARGTVLELIETVGLSARFGRFATVAEAVEALRDRQLARA